MVEVNVCCENDSLVVIMESEVAHRTHFVACKNIFLLIFTIKIYLTLTDFHVIFMLKHIISAANAGIIEKLSTQSYSRIQDLYNNGSCACKYKLFNPSAFNFLYQYLKHL